MIGENHEKTPVRLVGTGIQTRNLPNESLVRYHGATSLGIIIIIIIIISFSFLLISSFFLDHYMSKSLTFVPIQIDFPDIYHSINNFPDKFSFPDCVSSVIECTLLS